MQRNEKGWQKSQILIKHHTALWSRVAAFYHHAPWCAVRMHAELRCRGTGSCCWGRHINAAGVEQC